MKVPISGYVKPGFEKVKSTFEENFKLRKEVGAACCVYYRGNKVVDLWGGFRDKKNNIGKKILYLLHSPLQKACHHWHFQYCILEV